MMSELPRLQAELEDQLLELDEMGCFFKDWDFSVGLVDFPAVIDGWTVFLCWRSDEKELAWYHPIDEGFQGRRPLPESFPCGVTPPVGGHSLTSPAASCDASAWPPTAHCLHRIAARFSPALARLRPVDREAPPW